MGSVYSNFFYSRVIGGIRHLGIILAGVRKGYKLGCSAKSGTGIAVCGMELLREAA